ncbi:MAG: Asp-tRNA(Asn)/Glu-tRNA(Gln) amidotransferase subunit GatB [Acidobacteriota bacterium]|nr:Asp-tRNA(Asn)/Glu-tRNA(Gln) amidotransferase subunit GatB [Acidobacteriota bacterium]
MSYEPVIGLEIHAQLLTRSKIFCGCSTAFGAPPNTHVCPVCLGLPGALPVLNRQAVDFAIRTGLALGCRIQSRSIFARKNYFYPDLPKGYQISQYELPVAVDGALEWTSDGQTRRVGITRVHMEEDAGKSLHEGFADAARRSYVDFNRSGVPLVEIVTEPDLRSAADAADFFERLRAILVRIGVNDGNMEEGSLRCDANVSVRPAGATTLGTKAEVKNLNSFRFLQKALEYEIARQTELLEEGGTVTQETRLWDAAAGVTVSMRSKEEAHDYRYFPEPDLPPLVIDDARVEATRAALPELPAAREARYVAEFGLPKTDAATLVLRMPGLDDYFEATAQASGNPREAANTVLGLVRARMNDEGIGSVDALRAKLPEARLAELIGLVTRGEISRPVAKDVFDRMFASGEPAAAIVAREGLAQIDDEAAITAVIARVLAEQEDAVAQYRGGRTATFGFLVGQVMRATGGKANPKRVNALLRQALEAES